MIKVDFSLFIQIANFLLLVWAMNKVLYKPIRRMLSERRGIVGDLESTISDSARKVAEAEEAYRQGLKEARARGTAEKALLVAEAEAEERRMMAKINADAQEELARIREKIARDAKEVAISLEAEVGGFASRICEKLLGRALG